MRVLVWHWGRRGAGPRYAALLASALGSLPGVAASLSLSTRAELLEAADPPANDLPMRTYGGVASLAARLPGLALEVGGLAARLRGFDLAICAMPAMLDLAMAAALRRAGVPFWVVVHDADAHPGDGMPGQLALQRALCRRAAGLVALSAHVGDRLRAQGFRRVILSRHPPFAFGPTPPPPGTHGGPLRLLFFGRLLAYKGLDLLAEALRLVPPGIEARVVGQGPEGPALASLRALPGVRVENRWTPEDEIGDLLAWADAVVLPYREASQSGAAAAAFGAGRWVVATRVGGLAEQLAGLGSLRMCEPTPRGLAEAIASLLTSPPAAPCAPDPAAAWRDAAAALLREIGRTGPYPAV